MDETISTETLTGTVPGEEDVKNYLRHRVVTVLEDKGFVDISNSSLRK